MMTTRRSIVATALALGLAAVGVAVGPTTPASADPPPAGAGTTSHGFVYEDGVLTTIDHPDATTIPATPDGQAGTGITGNNDRGDLLGSYERSNRTVQHFVLDRRGRYTELDDPPGVSGPGLTYETVDINNHREIVGFYNDDQGATTTGFLRTRKGRFVDIKVPNSTVTGPVKLNDRGQVVGLYVDDKGVHGFLWDDGDYRRIDVRGAAATIPFGINNKGQIVGNYIDDDGVYHVFLRDRRGRVTTLRDAPGSDPTAGDATLPAGINDHGQIVGAVYYADGGSRGFVLKCGRYRMIDGKRNAVYTRALDINNRGQIVGDYATKPPTDPSSSSSDSATRLAMSTLADGMRLPSDILD
jgi:hypothetical protein